MKVVIVKWTAVSITVAAVVFGCTTVLQDADDQTSLGGSSTIQGGFALVESEFSDASISPGGIAVGGGDADEVEEGGEATRSFFTAFQIDPEAEDTAGPKFIRHADVNQDGLVDLLTAHNQNQPVQLHLQQRDGEGRVSFRTINLGGTNPLAIMAGIEFGFINDDEWLDIVVLAKASGNVTLCPTVPPSQISSLEGEIAVLFNPGSAEELVDGDAWTQMLLVNPFVRCRRGTTGEFWIHNQFPGNEDQPLDEIKAYPELNGFTSLAVGDIDGQPGDDIVVTLNVGPCVELGQEPPINTVDLWLNPGPGSAEIPNQWGTPFFADDPDLATSCPGSHVAHPPDAGEIPYAEFLNVPVAIQTSAAEFREVKLLDVDEDGDLDVVLAASNSISQNVRWIRNPLVPHRVGGPSGRNAVEAASSDGWRYLASEWETRAIGQIDTGADKLTLGDVDGDGATDVLVRSTLGTVQWFRHPTEERRSPEFPPPDVVPDRFNFPWEVYTLTEFDSQRPEGVALGDVTGDGVLDLVVAAEGAAFWYDATSGGTVYDPWVPNTIIQDSSEDIDAGTASGAAGSTAPGTTAPGAGVGVNQTDTSTVINDLLVIDIDDDGRLDIVGTLDRRSGPGLS
ncbi:MAG: FG-GAP repeat domain-containing protein, partial [Phycisphaerae bacterium]